MAKKEAAAKKKTSLKERLNAIDRGESTTKSDAEAKTEEQYRKSTTLSERLKDIDAKSKERMDEMEKAREEKRVKRTIAANAEKRRSNARDWKITGFRGFKGFVS